MTIEDVDTAWADGTDMDSGPVLSSGGSVAEVSELPKTPEPSIEDLTVQHIDEFLSDYDKPSPDELEQLVVAGTPEAWENLRNLADQYDILVDDGTGPKDIAEKVRQAMDNAEEMNY